MRLVGAMLVNGEEWHMSAFGSLFGRMKQVEHAGDPMRYVGFEGACGDHVDVRFFGVEVGAIGRIPEGMVAWDIDADHWVVTQPSGDEWRSESEWLWCGVSAQGRACGEFAALCAAEWVGSSDPRRREFRMTSNAYLARDRGPDDEIRLVDYDPSWPAQYEEIAVRVRYALGPAALRLEHYGSTAIPGMPAKPVIDVLVEVPSFAEARKHAIPAFDSPEAEYWWYSGHVVFIIRSEFLGRRTHHLHLAPAGHNIWNGIAFRDFLIAHPEDAARYAALKHTLAQRYKADREEYTQAKADFVKEIAARIRGCSSLDRGL